MKYLTLRATNPNLPPRKLKLLPGVLVHSISPFLRNQRNSKYPYIQPTGSQTQPGVCTDLNRHPRYRQTVVRCPAGLNDNSALLNWAYKATLKAV